MNTEARIVAIQNGQVPISDVLDTGLFNLARAQQSPGWLKERRGEHIPEAEEYGISSVSYQARRPFHPGIFLHNTRRYGKLIRSKGYFWLATRPEFAGQWNQASGIAHYDFAGMFWKALPKDQWPTDPDYSNVDREKLD